MLTVGSRSELLSYGYCREIEQESNLSSHIPDIVMQCVTDYNTQYEIIGIGGNDHGQLLIEDDNNTLAKWTRLMNFENMIPNYNNIYRNESGVLLINAKHEIYAGGENSYNRLGIDSTSGMICIPYLVPISNDIILASTGIHNSYHTFIYSADDTLYASGRNNSGQFGNGEKEKRMTASTLRLIPRFWNMNERIIDIQCGWKHSVFLTDHNNVYEAGNDTVLTPEMIYSYLNGKESIKEIAVGCYMNILLKRNGDLFICGDTTAEVINVMTYFKKKNIKIQSVCCGYRHALVLSVDNKCYSFGLNDHGQCGTGTTSNIYDDLNIPYLISSDVFAESNEYIVDFSCGVWHSLVLTNENKIYSFGGNLDHQCTSKDIKKVLKPLYLDKCLELGVSKNACIDSILCLARESVVIINPNKQLRH